LAEIADVIKKNPQVKKISIEGHASAEGEAKHNKKLSDDRAKAVMEHLVKKDGVDAARMVAKGWGVEKPIAANDTEENREKNRRPRRRRRHRPPPPHPRRSSRRPRRRSDEDLAEDRWLYRLARRARRHQRLCHGRAQPRDVSRRHEGGARHEEQRHSCVLRRR